MTIGEAACSNCSNYAIVLVPDFCDTWGRTGVASVQTSTSSPAPLYIDFTPSGRLPSTSITVKGPASSQPRPVVKQLSERHLAFAMQKGTAQPSLP